MEELVIIQTCNAAYFFVLPSLCAYFDLTSLVTTIFNEHPVYSIYGIYLLIICIYPVVIFSDCSSLDSLAFSDPGLYAAAPRPEPPEPPLTGGGGRPSLPTLPLVSSPRKVFLQIMFGRNMSEYSVHTSIQMKGHVRNGDAEPCYGGAGGSSRRHL